MTISSVNASTWRDMGTSQTKKSQADEATATFALPVPATTSAPEASATAASASPTTVQYSASASAIAQLAAQGVSVRTVSFNPLSEQVAGSQAPDTIPANGSVSKSEFESLVTQFGGSTAQADQLFASFDANGDGSISQSEFLSGLGTLTNGGANTPFAQSLGALMDDHGSRDGVVSGSEFIGFETAFLNAETATGSSAAVADNVATPKQGSAT